MLADYTPHTSPMVPAIIVYCVNELETRGLTEVGNLASVLLALHSSFS